jgi:hypothetical protein
VRCSRVIKAAHGLSRRFAAGDTLRKGTANVTAYRRGSGRNQSYARTIDEVHAKKAPMIEALKDPKLAVRLNARSRYIWELLSDDRHVVNRSDNDFETVQDCQADARAKGHR